MNSHVMIAVLVLAGVAASAGPGAAQDLTAEVRTWGGQSLRLTQPLLEVFYTILPKGEEGAGTPPAPGTALAPEGGSSSMATGSIPGLSIPTLPPPGRAAEPKQGRRQEDVLRLFRDGMEIQLPLVSIASLHFFRQPIADSPFPPYAARLHFRYSVVTVLTDGSRVEGDYINLGTTVLRGMTGQGRVKIPWEEIEVLRFER